jgi:hypothetical protein
LAFWGSFGTSTVTLLGAGGSGDSQLQTGTTSFAGSIILTSQIRNLRWLKFANGMTKQKKLNVLDTEIFALSKK